MGYLAVCPKHYPLTAHNPPYSPYSPWSLDSFVFKEFIYFLMVYGD
jgi:hypothetical protein